MLHDGFAFIAELYDPESMPANLRAAHDRNDEVLERMVWTPRNGNVRIISVRRARQSEKEALNAYLQKLH